MNERDPRTSSIPSCDQSVTEGVHPTSEICVAEGDLRKAPAQLPQSR